ncbi:MAG: hypothetical protein ACPG8W_06955 [Candidatus Promineifilaceae bacterium]
MTKRRFVLPLLLILLLVHSPQPAYACSCGWVDAKEHLSADYTKRALIGRVIDIQIVDSEAISVSSLDVTFAVQRVLKGDKAKEITIRTIDSGGLCGYHFVLDERYLVFLGENNWTGLCSGNVENPSSLLIAQLDNRYMALLLTAALATIVILVLVARRILRTRRVTQATLS